MAQNKIFEQIDVKRPNKNVFDLSHEVKTSFNMGELIPFLCQEVLPSDTFKVNSEVLLRFMPMLFPVMHRVDVYTHYFFVPNRIIWDDWEDFITGGEDGLSAPNLPQLSILHANRYSWDKGRLGDYLGIPPVDPSLTVIDQYTVSKLPFLAYAEIYNEYYRDQNLTNRIDLDTASTTDLTELRTRAWEKDYFSSALPWTQRGAEVELPLQGLATLVNSRASTADWTRVTHADGAEPSDANIVLRTAHGDGTKHALQADLTDDLNFDITGHTSVDLTSASSVTINELRASFRMQEWLEKMARGGSHYHQQLLHMFGVTSSDARMQRPEYLGGGKQPVVISEVLQTSAETTTPIGEMAGHGLSIGKSNRFSKTFEEHGHVIGIISVLPRTGYHQGIPKPFKRTIKEDFFWTQFAQLGEQEIDISELYVDYYNAQPSETFGYQQRYAEYKYSMDRISGEFRSTLKNWHLNRIFSSKPTLNTAFIECDASHRIFAVTDTGQDKLMAQIWLNIKAIRPIPYFNIPTI